MEAIDIGLIFEAAILAMATYVYLFATGIIKPKSREGQQKQQSFIQQNNRIVRILALAIMAITTINIMLRFF